MKKEKTAPIEDEAWQLCPEELPEGISQFILDEVRPDDNILLYKKGNVRGLCYQCGEKVKAHPMQRFRQHSMTRCPNCNAVVTCMLEGSNHFKVDYVQDIASIQKGTDGKTVFIRQWHILRPGDVDWTDVPKLLEEIARYAIRGNKIAQWRMEGKESWYMQSWRYRNKTWERFNRSSEVYDGTYVWYLPRNYREILDGTSLQYCEPKEYTYFCREKKIGKNAIRFLMDWARYPAVEKIWKAGYHRVVTDRINQCTKENRNAVLWSQDSIQKALRFPMRMLKIMEPEEWRLDDVQYTRELWPMVEEKKVTERECALLVRSGVEMDHIKDALNFASATKLLHYLEKQRAGRLNIGIDYRDYIKDCIALGLDLTDESVLLPGNLLAAHGRTTAMRQYKANAEKEKDFEEARKKAEKLAWQEGGLMIRPAGSQQELIAEGATLHHCVGGYADRMAAGKLVIMLIRKVEDKDTPYYTLEWDGGRVVQCRTLRNESYEKNKEVFAFVNRWVSHVNGKIYKKERKTA